MTPNVFSGLRAVGLAVAIVVAAATTSGAQSPFQDVIRNLRHPSVETRLDAVERLAAAGHTPAAEAVAALALDPDFSAALADQGLVARRRGDHGAAEAGYRRAIAADPANADARYNLAMLLAETGRRAEARRELERLLAADPTDDEARRELGTLLR